jgi:hypothetical protein
VLKLAAGKCVSSFVAKYGTGIAVGTVGLFVGKRLLRAVPVVGLVASPFLMLLPTLIVGPVLGARARPRAGRPGGWLTARRARPRRQTAGTPCRARAPRPLAHVPPPGVAGVYAKDHGGVGALGDLVRSVRGRNGGFISG